VAGRVSYLDVEQRIRATHEVVRAYMRFADEVAQVTLDMAERGDPSCLRLVQAMRDLQARSGEYVISEETE
jgi:hypothetical protein